MKENGNKMLIQFKKFGADPCDNFLMATLSLVAPSAGDIVVLNDSTYRVVKVVYYFAIDEYGKPKENDGEDVIIWVE